MSRIDALHILLAALRDSQPEEFRAFMRELLDRLGYADVHEAFDDLVAAPPLMRRH